MGMPEGEEREKGTEEIYEAKMTENILELMSDTKQQIQKSHRTPSRINDQIPPPHTHTHTLKKRHLGISYMNCRKSKIKKNNPERSQKEITPYLQSSTDKNYIRFLLRNYANKERVE